MTACATRDKIYENVSVCNLILPVPDTDFRDFLEEVDQLARFAPEIIALIEKDMDCYAQKKKSLRLDIKTSPAVSARVNESLRFPSEPGNNHACDNNDSRECESGQPCDAGTYL